MLIGLIMDDGILRQSLRSMLTDRGFRVANDPGHGAFSNPHVVELIQWPSHRGVACLADVALDGTHPPVVALTDRPDESVLLDAVHRGAVAVVPLGSSADLLVTAIDQAALGYATLPHGVCRRLAELVRGGSVVASMLADHERRWLRGLADNLSLAEIARREGYSERHLRRLLSAAYVKLGVTNRPAALARAGELGLITSPPSPPHGSMTGS